MRRTSSTDEPLWMERSLNRDHYGMRIRCIRTSRQPGPLMEPQDNKKLALGKAVSAHDQAEAALNDLMKDGPDPIYTAMVERIQRNIQELRAQAATSSPAEHI